MTQNTAFQKEGMGYNKKTLDLSKPQTSRENFKSPNSMSDMMVCLS